MLFSNSWNYEETDLDKLRKDYKKLLGQITEAKAELEKLRQLIVEQELAESNKAEDNTNERG